MTATNATDPLAVLESGFKIIPGKETDFLAYQAEVVPLAVLPVLLHVAAAH